MKPFDRALYEEKLSYALEALIFAKEIFDKLGFRGIDKMDFGKELNEMISRMIEDDIYPDADAAEAAAEFFTENNIGQSPFETLNCRGLTEYD